ncbi:MAG: efflux RND transporter periplasmic adaptor subunit [Moorea sp. SIO2B7]|nr:efflux RND transporter periplasmic adaptor subunit [Moorena sp. SIO2B7]
MSVVILLLLSITGCSLIEKIKGLDNSQSNKSQTQKRGGVTSVDVAIARLDSLEEVAEYVGSTKPVSEVSLRSQVEGRLLSLNVDVGDKVTQGQILARLDDTLLANAVSQEKAELATLEAQLAQSKVQVNNARIQFERLRLQFQQAKNDAARFTELAKVGAISQQQAESSETEAKVAQKAVFAAQEQIISAEKAVAAAYGRIAAQKAVIAENQQRQAYAKLISPISGVVLQKVSEPGNLISPGGEVLKLGDFSLIKVIVPVSELDLPNISLGQSVEVKLDAFPKQYFSGKVSRISPVANSSARQIPVEITIPNPNAKIGSGLLARVRFQSSTLQRVILPQSAVIGEGSSTAIFVISHQGKEKKTQVRERKVTIGNRMNGKVEIISGIKPGERFVVKSGKVLTDGDTVRLSILSE